MGSDGEEWRVGEEAGAERVSCRRRPNDPSIPHRRPLHHVLAGASTDAADACRICSALQPSLRAYRRWRDPCPPAILSFVQTSTSPARAHRQTRGPSTHRRRPFLDSTHQALQLPRLVPAIVELVKAQRPVLVHPQHLGLSQPPRDAAWRSAVGEGSKGPDLICADGALALRAGVRTGRG
jgi:hypothetical protein